MAVADVIKKIKDDEIKFVDLRFTDTVQGAARLHSGRIVTEDWFEDATRSTAPRSPAGRASRLRHAVESRSRFAYMDPSLTSDPDPDL